MFTKEQKAYFDTFGFIAVRKLFSINEMDIIIREFEAAMLSNRNGKPFDGKSRQIVLEWFRGRPDVEYIASDERVHGPIKQILGPGYSMSKENDSNFYIGDTGWHSDLGWDPHIPQGESDPRNGVNGGQKHYIPSIKVAFYLDTVGKETGCLRVIPGSHKNPFHDRLWSLHLDIPRVSANPDKKYVGPSLLDMWTRDTGNLKGGEHLLSDPDVNHFGIAPSDVPSHPIESEPGDAVFFSHQMWHSSFGGKAGRRMFTLNFYSAQN